MRDAAEVAGAEEGKYEADLAPTKTVEEMIRAQRKVEIRSKVREARARWLEMAQQTADTNLTAHLSGKQTMAGRLESLRRELDLDSPPSRMECFDISHSSGEATVASCVVFDHTGPRKADYRKFNVDGIQPGDDYAAMQQALERRYVPRFEVRSSKHWQLDRGFPFDPKQSWPTQ